MTLRLSISGAGLYPGLCWGRRQWTSLVEEGWGACGRERILGKVGEAETGKAMYEQGFQVPSICSVVPLAFT